MSVDQSNLFDLQALIEQDIEDGQINAQLRAGPEKEVVLRTPVMIGIKGLTPELNHTKLKYRKDHLLNDRSVPPLPPTLKNTMVIRMPVEGIDEYFDENLKAWLPLRSDEELVEGLLYHLNERATFEEGKQTKRRKVRFEDLMGSKLFHSLDERT